MSENQATQEAITPAHQWCDGGGMVRLLNSEVVETVQPEARP